MRPRRPRSSLGFSTRLWPRARNRFICSPTHHPARRIAMPRYLVERTFPDGLHIPTNADGAGAMRSIVATNAEEGVSWVHSYVSEDKTRTFCVYDAPSPEA